MSHQIRITPQASFYQVVNVSGEDRRYEAYIVEPTEFDGFGVKYVHKKEILLETIQFRPPRSPLWPMIDFLWQVQFRQTENRGKPKHTMEYVTEYRRLRTAGLPRGLAKRQALTSRHEADLQTAQWQAYEAYLHDRPAFLAHIKEICEQTEAIAREQDRQFRAEAWPRWLEEVEEFKKKWKGEK